MQERQMDAVGRHAAGRSGVCPFGWVSSGWHVLRRLPLEVRRVGSKRRAQDGSEVSKLGIGMLVVGHEGSGLAFVWQAVDSRRHGVG